MSTIATCEKPAVALIGGTPRDTAIRMLAAGLWPVPIQPGEKRPIGKGWGLKRNTLDTIRAGFKQYPKAGVGVCLGPGRGPGGSWLIDIEGDGPEAEESRSHLFGGEIVSTLGWGSARGGHQLLTATADRVAELLKSLGNLEGKGLKTGVYHLPEFPGLEIRFGGFNPNGSVKQIQSVMPPTVGTDGKHREWNGVAEIAPAPESLYEALRRAAAPPETEPTNGGDDGTMTATGPTDRPGQWLASALRNAAGRVAMAPAGNRHPTLLAETRTLAGYLHYSLGFTEEELARTMTEAANRAAPERPDDNARTVRDAIGFGKDAPLTLQDELHRLTAFGAKPSGNGKHRGPPPTATGAEPAGRPTIIVSTEEHDVNDQAVKALAADPTVFQRGWMLITVRRDTTCNHGIIRPPGSPQIAPLPLPRLRERLSKYAAWVKWSKLRDGGFEEVPSHPPDWSVSAIAVRAEWPEIRPLEAVVETPILRPDGTILDVTGYDHSTGLLYEPNAAFPRIKDRPTREDAKEAAFELLDLVEEFPFKQQPHSVAWLAALLTPAARFAIAGPCPLFLFDSPAAGSGKGLLCDIASVINTGREMSRKDYPEDNEEVRKIITAVALAGDRLMLLDNIASSFGGSALDGALTARTWKDRILGRSEMTPDLPLFTVWYGTGNNVQIKGDAMRRIIPCRVEPLVERPEERNGFKYPNLMQHVHQNRPRLAAAVLTILRAYVVAGRPDQKLTPLGSFEAWSDLVRSALVWTLGKDMDPCAAREDLRAADDAASDLAAVIEGWAELPGKGMTAAQALKTVREAPASYATLRDVLMNWSRTDDLPSQRVVGNRLKAMRGKVIGDRFMHSVEYQGTQTWSVRSVSPRGSGGSGGSS